MRDEFADLVKRIEAGADRNPTLYKIKLLLLAMLGYAYIFLVLAVLLVLIGLLLWAILSGKGLNSIVVNIEIALLVLVSIVARSLWVKVPAPKGIELSKEQAPALFATVDEIRRAVDGPVVHRILITPDFNACRHEYEADLCASEVATAQTAAEALIKCEVYSRFVTEKFWNEFSELVKSQSSPPNYYSEMAASLKAGVQSDDSNRWLQSALKTETASWDTHPSLKDRLNALSQTPRLPAPTTESAAEIYFGDELSRLIERLDVEWHEENAAAWKEEYEDYRDLDRELRELNVRAASTNLTPEEAYRRACLVHSITSAEAALPLYREALSLDKDCAVTNYAIGRLLLSEDNEEGIAYLERAMDLNEKCVPDSCHLLYSYFTKKGDVVTAQRYSRRATALARVYANAAVERSQASFVDRFISHDLTEQDVEQLRRELTKNDRIREAYLVRKELKYKPERPLYALGLVFDQPRLKRSISDAEFAKQLPATLKTEWQLLSFVLDAQNKRLGTILRNIPNSLIYQR